MSKRYIKTETLTVTKTEEVRVIEEETVANSDGRSQADNMIVKRIVNWVLNLIKNGGGMNHE